MERDASGVGYPDVNGGSGGEGARGRPLEHHRCELSGPLFKVPTNLHSVGRDQGDPYRTKELDIRHWVGNE